MSDQPGRGTYLLLAAFYLLLCFLIGLVVVSIAFPRVVRAYDGCYAVPISSNTPTGIAGCQVWGDGIASEYGAGGGVATNWCTWTVRMTTGCGTVTITAKQTGRTVSVPVVDFCDCFTGTPDQRIVDLQSGVVAALGLNAAAGLWPVSVARGLDPVAMPPGQPSPPGGEVPAPALGFTGAPPPAEIRLPDTAMP